MVDESVTVKGSPVRSLQKFIDAELSQDQKNAVLDRLRDARHVSAATFVPHRVS